MGRFSILLYLGIGFLVFFSTTLGLNRVYNDEWGLSTNRAETEIAVDDQKEINWEGIREFLDNLGAKQQEKSSYSDKDIKPQRVEEGDDTSTTTQTENLQTSPSPSQSSTTSQPSEDSASQSTSSECTTGSWVDDACGGGSCSSNKRQQTRTTNPTGCASATRCITDTSCEDTSPPTDTTSPLVSNIQTSDITTSSVTITWTTDETSDSQVEFDTTPCPCSNESVLLSTLTTSHSINFSDLTPNAIYYFRVKSRDEAGNLTTSESNTFTTEEEQPTSTVHDMKSYYPNPQLYNNYYLEGFNYISGAARAVLWFEELDQQSFKMYNSAPEDIVAQCHWDLLGWWNDDTFRYTKTHHECPGATPNETVFDPPILFIPRYWDDSGSWSYSGSASTEHYENDILVCTGTNNYTNTIIGWEDVAPGESSIHWRTNQVTTWDDFGNCSGWAQTRWQEDYWFTGQLPVEGGGTAKALKRSKGGNLEIPEGRWDVWFDLWKGLP